MRTPALVAFDSSLDLVPVPFLIVDWVDGVDLETSRSDPAATDDIWTEVGRDLALLHDRVRPRDWPRGATPVPTTAADAEASLRQRVDDGWFSYIEGTWFDAWLARLAAGVGEPSERRATHGDVQMSNVLMSSGAGRYTALLDWGCASAKDPVIDFMPMPFAAVPALLRGHREVAPLPDDDTAERRILLYRLRTLLGVLPRGPAPDMTWGERPTAWLIDLLRFFQSPPTEVWRELAPR